MSIQTASDRLSRMITCFCLWIGLIAATLPVLLGNCILTFEGSAVVFGPEGGEAEARLRLTENPASDPSSCPGSMSPVRSNVPWVTVTGVTLDAGPIGQTGRFLDFKIKLKADDLGELDDREGRLIGEVSGFTDEIDVFQSKCDRSFKVLGVVEAAGFQPAVSSCGVVSVFGVFGCRTATSTSVPLERQLDNLSFKFDGVDAAIFGVFSNRKGTGEQLDQANVQTPCQAINDSPPRKIEVTVERETPEPPNSGQKKVRSEPFEVQIQPATPGIYTFQFGGGPGIVQNLDGTFAQPAGSLGTVATQPASVGGIIIVWANGLGPVNGTVTTGNAPGLDSPLLETVKDIKLFIGGKQAQILGKPILHPTLVGVNQLNAIVPDGVALGDEVPIEIEVDCGEDGVFHSRSDVFIAVGPAK